jgi:methyl-accepting chemotaxis protein
MAQLSKALIKCAIWLTRFHQQPGTLPPAQPSRASAIEQINQGTALASMVVQINAATAEESSASSQELAAQAQML